MRKPGKTTNLLEWHGFLLIKDGIYANSKIKFVVTFPVTFPQNIPELRLITPLFHPIIAEDGRIDMNVSASFGGPGGLTPLGTAFLGFNGVGPDS